MLAFLISLFAIWISKRPAAGALTWGSHRYELVGAVMSVFLIWVLTLVLCIEAVDRMLHPAPVDGLIMFITALAGLLVNLGMMKILHQDVGGHGGHSHSHGGHSHGAHENLNVSAAFIHVLGDLLQSVGVMVAAIIIWIKPDLTIVDPICTFLFSILVLFTTVNIMRSALNSALSAAPAYVSLPALTRGLLALPGVKSVYGLHVWEYGGLGDKSKVAMEAHVVAAAGSELGAVLAGALGVAAANGIAHPTIQVEPEGTRGGVTDAAGVTLDVYEEGGEPAGTIVADLMQAITGWRPCARRGFGVLYHLAPPKASLGALKRAGAEAGACAGGEGGHHGHSHGGHGHGGGGGDHGHSHGGGGGGGGGDHGHSHGGAEPPPSFPAGHSHSHPALSLSFK